MFVFILIVIALAFAWSMGAHYTGACMGMAFAGRAIRLRPALWLMAALTLCGAALASHGVEITVGERLVGGARLPGLAALIVLVAAFALTTIYTYIKVPTSTIQILVFAVIGVALAWGVPVHWGMIVRLAILWVVAPVAAFGAGYLLTRVADRRVAQDQRKEVDGRTATVATLLVVFGALASFAMGANDVANATGMFLQAHVMGVWPAGVIGGIGLALGVLTWGRRLLETVAFEIVELDRAMAATAQFAQAAVILAAAFSGYFTSMNQALVGAMAGTGVARGHQTVRWKTVAGILRGWFVGPLSGVALAFLLGQLVRLSSGG